MCHVREYYTNVQLGLDFYEIHGAQRMNPGDFGDPMNFPLGPSSGQNVYLYNTLVYDKIPAKLFYHQSQLHFLFSAN